MDCEAVTVEQRSGIDRRSAARPTRGRRADDQYWTPAQLCERFQVDIRTLDKFDLPWVWLTGRIRRVHPDALEAWIAAKGPR